MLNAQTQRNMAQAGLPVALSEGRYTGRLTLLSNGRHALDFYGGDGRVRRMTAIPFAVQAPKRKYERRSGKCVTIRPSAA